jgi:hypothetical protein
MACSAGAKGKLFLEYYSKAYLGSKDPAYRGRNMQNQLLEISWDHINSKQANLDIKIHPNQKIPQIDLF